MFLTDVTIREGGQLPGRSYSIEQKIDAAHALDSLGVEYIQATFPATGPQDRAVTRNLSNSVNAAVVSLARAKRKDVDACIDAGADVVEVFGTLSESYLTHAVGLAESEMLSRLVEETTHIRDHGITPHVTLLDGVETDPKRLHRGFERLEDVPIVTLADTTGAATPRTVEDVLTKIRPAVDSERVGFHFHDDLGLAMPNFLVAMEHDVGRVDVSVGGIGERAGNLALETVVAYCVLHRDEPVGVDYRDLVPRCREILLALQEDIDEFRPVLGDNVFGHEAGIHTQAMLNEMSTFEPFEPGLFGGERRLLFGRGTGRAAAKMLLERIDAPTDAEMVSRLLAELQASGPLELDGALALADAVVTESGTESGQGNH